MEKASEEERKARWRDETNQLYQAIGEFVVKFEHVTLALTLIAKAILERTGLRDEQVSSIILAGMTAEPLRSLVEALASQTGYLRSDDMEHFRSVLKRFQSLTSERNDVVHGAWLVEWFNYASHQDEFEIAKGFKLHKNKDGVATKEFRRDIADFARLTSEAEELRMMLHKLLGKFIFDKAGNQLVFKAKNLD